MTTRQPLAHKFSVGDTVRVSCYEDEVREGVVMSVNTGAGFVSLHSGSLTNYRPLQFIGSLLCTCGTSLNSRLVVYDAFRH